MLSPAASLRRIVRDRFISIAFGLARRADRPGLEAFLRAEGIDAQTLRELRRIGHALEVACTREGARRHREERDQSVERTGPHARRPEDRPLR